MSNLLNVTLVMRDGDVGTPREVVGLLEKQKPTVYIGEYSLMVRRKDLIKWLDTTTAKGIMVGAIVAGD